MIRSMTGYGTAKGNSGNLALTVELKSVNNRYLDVSVRIPRLYAYAEESVKSTVTNAAGRGKVDVWISVDDTGDGEVEIKLNEPLVEAYRTAFETMNSKWGINNDVGASAYSKLPDVFIVEKKEIDSDRFCKDLSIVLDETLKNYNTMRENEGERLKNDILGKLSELERLTALVSERSPASVAEWRDKLTKRMKDVLADTNIDEARILTEAALFADKVAVDEELVRLKSHIAQCRELFSAGGSVGRKLDFLVQELNRETNTIGSKCTDLKITHMVLDMKAEIEKIREQAQNIE